MEELQNEGNLLNEEEIHYHDEGNVYVVELLGVYDKELLEEVDVAGRLCTCGGLHLLYNL